MTSVWMYIDGFRVLGLKCNVPILTSSKMRKAGIYIGRCPTRVLALSVQVPHISYNFPRVTDEVTHTHIYMWLEHVSGSRLLFSTIDFDVACLFTSTLSVLSILLFPHFHSHLHCQSIILYNASMPINDFFFLFFFYSLIFMIVFMYI